MSLIQAILITAAVAVVGAAVLSLIIIARKRRPKRVCAYAYRSRSRPFRPHATRRVKRQGRF